MSSSMLMIRRYEDADHDEVWRLHNLALERAGVHAGSGPWDRDFDDIRGMYLENSGEFLVGEYEGRIVAMGALRRTTAERAEIKRMRVHPDFQRHGFGQAILQALESRAAELGYTILHLDTPAKQLAAQGLYEKNGYRQTGTTVLGGIESILYEKELGRET
jgi:ribosomal protein S18 acetylase RimI-like enzyme